MENLDNLVVQRAVISCLKISFEDASETGVSRYVFFDTKSRKAIYLFESSATD